MELQGAVLRFDEPPEPLSHTVGSPEYQPTHTAHTAGRNSTPGLRRQVSWDATPHALHGGATAAAPRPAAEVRIGRVVVSTPDPSEPTAAMRAVQHALDSPADGLNTVTISEQQREVIYTQMQFEVHQVEVLYSSPDSSGGLVASDGVLQPLLPPLSVVASLATSRAGADPVLPATSVHVRATGLENATLRTSAIAALIAAITRAMKAPQLPQPQHLPAATIVASQPSQLPASPQQKQTAVQAAPVIGIAAQSTATQAGYVHQPSVRVALAYTGASHRPIALQLTAVDTHSDAALQASTSESVTVQLTATDTPAPSVSMRLTPAPSYDAETAACPASPQSPAPTPSGRGGASPAATPARARAQPPQRPAPAGPITLIQAELPATSVTLIDDRAAAATAANTPTVHRYVSTTTNTSVTLSFDSAAADVSISPRGLSVSAHLNTLQIQTGFASNRQAVDVSEYRPSVLQPWLQIARQVTVAHIDVGYSRLVQPPAVGGVGVVGQQPDVEMVIRIDTQGLTVYGYPDQPSNFLLPASGRGGDVSSCVSVEYSYTATTVATDSQSSSAGPAAAGRAADGPAGSARRVVVSKVVVGVKHVSVGIGIVPAVLSMLANRQPAGPPPQPSEAPPRPPPPPPAPAAAALPSEFHFVLSADAECLSVVDARTGGIDAAGGAGTAASCCALLGIEHVHFELPLFSTPWGAQPPASGICRPIEVKHLLLCLADNPAGTRLLPAVHIPSLVLSRSTPPAGSGVTGGVDMDLDIPSVRVSMLQSQAAALSALLSQLLTPSPAAARRKAAKHSDGNAAPPAAAEEAAASRGAHAPSSTATQPAPPRTPAPPTFAPPAWVVSGAVLRARLGRLCCWWEACTVTVPNQLTQLLISGVQLDVHGSSQPVNLQGFESEHATAAAAPAAAPAASHGRTRVWHNQGNKDSGSHTQHSGAHAHSSMHGEDGLHGDHAGGGPSHGAAHAFASLQWQEISLQLLRYKPHPPHTSDAHLGSSHSLLHSHSSASAPHDEGALAHALPAVDCAHVAILLNLAAASVRGVGRRRGDAAAGGLRASAVAPLPGGVPPTEALLSAAAMPGVAGAVGGAGGGVGMLSEESLTGITMSRFFSATGSLPQGSASQRTYTPTLGQDTSGAFFLMFLTIGPQSCVPHPPICGALSKCVSIFSAYACPPICPCLHHLHASALGVAAQAHVRVSGIHCFVAIVCLQAWTHRPWAHPHPCHRCLLYVASTAGLGHP